jgi:hypothetical protein
MVTSRGRTKTGQKMSDSEQTRRQTAQSPSPEGKIDFPRVGGFDCGEGAAEG